MNHSPTKAHPEAGRQLGPYEIRSKIGEGGMGEVYLALDTKLGRKVAFENSAI
jgi:serine/threonine protein kinase